MLLPKCFFLSLHLRTWSALYGWSTMLPNFANTPKVPAANLLCAPSCTGARETLQTTPLGPLRLRQTTCPAGLNMPQHTHLSFLSELTYRVPQVVYGESRSPSLLSIVAKTSAAGLIRSFPPNLRSARGRFCF